MFKRRYLLLVISVGLVLVLATGTSGFSQITNWRSMEIDVVEDESAYLGFDQDAEIKRGTTTVTITVTNLFPAGIELTTVEVTVGGQTQYIAPLYGLESGESTTAQFQNARCGDPIEIHAKGDSVTVSMVRIVKCANPPTETPRATTPNPDTPNPDTSDSKLQQLLP